MEITIQRDRARTMRKNMTDAERRLRVALRNRALGGFRFNRQVEIGPYIVDFLCRERKVIVELDGDTHSNPRENAGDRRRTESLEARGYVVFRAWNSDIRENLSGVLEGLLMVLDGHNWRNPSR